MSRNRINPEDKILAVQKYLEGKISQGGIASQFQVSKTSVQQWIFNYQSMGSEIFFQKKNKQYSKELKECAVLDYLAGKESQEDICRKYGIRSKSKLQKWIQVYNGHGELKSSGAGGTSVMTKGRKTTFDERVEIAGYCIAHEHNYAETAERYGISYQQARSYTVKYEQCGVGGLQDRRGRRKTENEMSELERLRAENKLLRAEKERAEMEASFLKKLDAIERGAGLSLIRHESIYQAIKEEHEAHGYPVRLLCGFGGISRAAYYKWRNREIPAHEEENRQIADEIEKIHNASPDKGYRRIRDELERYHGIKANDKRVLRICRKRGIKSTIKYRNNGCTRQAENPQHIAENLLNREFTAGMPNEKWLTDVTEFHYYTGMEKHKVYLSAILDLYDRRIVSYIIGDSNNNTLVFDTFDAAVEANPDAHPLFHSDRGFQYTCRNFHSKLEAAGMKQSMSRVAKCIDNGPMEGFWGILKRERYYGKRFTSRESVVEMIENYIDYYNNKRLQRNLGILTPMEKHRNYLLAA